MQNNQNLQLLNADADTINDSLYINELLGLSKAFKREKLKYDKKKERKKRISKTAGKLDIPEAKEAIKKYLTEGGKSPWTPAIIDNTLNESTFNKEVLNNADLIIELKTAIIENDEKKISSIVSANALKTSLLNKDISTLLGKKTGNSRSKKATQDKVSRDLGVEASFRNKNLNFLLEEESDNDTNSIDPQDRVDPFHNFIDDYLKSDIDNFYDLLLKHSKANKKNEVIARYAKYCENVIESLPDFEGKYSEEQKLVYIRRICMNDRDVIEKDDFIGKINDINVIKEENVIYYYLTVINNINKLYELLPYIFIKLLNNEKKESVLNYKNLKGYNERVKDIEVLFNKNVKAGFKIYEKAIKDFKETKEQEKEEKEEDLLDKFTGAQYGALYIYLSLIAHSRIQQKFYGVVENNIRNFKDQMKLEMQDDPKKKEDKETSIIKKAAAGYLTISYGVPLAIAAMGPLGWVAGPAVLAAFGSGTSMLMNNMTATNLSKLVKSMSPEAKIIGPQIYKKVRSGNMFENSFNRKGQLITEAEAASGDDVLKKIRNVLKTKNLLHFKYELNKNFSKFDSLFLSNMGAIISEYFGLETSKKEKDDQNVEGSEKAEFNAANKLIRVCAAQAKDFVKNADGKFVIDGTKDCDKAKFAKLINEIPVESRVPLFFKFIEVATTPEAKDFTWKSVFARLKLRDNSSVMNVVQTRGFDKTKNDEQDQQ